MVVNLVMATDLFSVQIKRIEESRVGRRACQVIQLILCILLFVPATALAGEKCDKIIEVFVLNNTRIFRDYSDPLKRREFYNEALKQLVKDVRSIYGPFCPCDEFLSKAAALQNHREAWRSPPAGWEPNKMRNTFRPLELEIAREDVRLLMELMSLCDEH